MKYIIYFVCFIVWIYFLWVLKRAQLRFQRFVLGSVGLFIFMMLVIQPVVTEPLTKIIALSAGQLGEITGLYDSYYQYSMLFIPKSTAAVSLYIDYECSGVIEIMAFTSLLWFFNVYKVHEKVILTFVGVFAISIFNIIRIFVICLMIYMWGNDMFYFAHSIFGRIVFYALSVALYFYVFTRGQIKRQKVGSFNYDK